MEGIWEHKEWGGLKRREEGRRVRLLTDSVVFCGFRKEERECQGQDRRRISTGSASAMYLGGGVGDWWCELSGAGNLRLRQSKENQGECEMAVRAGKKMAQPRQATQRIASLVRCKRSKAEHKLLPLSRRHLNCVLLFARLEGCLFSQCAKVVVW